MTQSAVVTTLCLFEIWAFDESVISMDQKVALSWMYVPFAVIPAIAVADMLGRVVKRVERVEGKKQL
jgi:hypothetical protein